MIRRDTMPDRARRNAHSLIDNLWDDWSCPNPSELTELITEWLTDTVQLIYDEKPTRGNRLLRAIRREARIFYEGWIKTDEHNAQYQGICQYYVGLAIVSTINCSPEEFWAFSVYNRLISDSAMYCMIHQETYAPNEPTAAKRK